MLQYEKNSFREWKKRQRIIYYNCLLPEMKRISLPDWCTDIYLFMQLSIVYQALSGSQPKYKETSLYNEKMLKPKTQHHNQTQVTLVQFLGNQFCLHYNSKLSASPLKYVWFIYFSVSQPWQVEDEWISTPRILRTESHTTSSCQI